MASRGTSYAGPESRIGRAAARKLGKGWSITPKIDGCYAEVHTDESGQIVRLVSRTAREYRTSNALAMHGCQIMPGRSVVVGELEDHTPAGQAAARGRGFPLVHLFDALAVGGEDLRGATYGQRHDALMRAWTCNADAQGNGRDTWYHDCYNRPHDVVTGDFCRRIPTSWLRAPVLEQWPVSRFDALWDEHVLSGRAEGLVLAHADARLGAKQGKRKVKPYDTIDCVVLEVLPGKLVLRTFGCPEFLCQWRGKRQIRPGNVVAVRHDGHYNTGVPKFARIDRLRTDLAAA